MDPNNESTHSLPRGTAAASKEDKSFRLPSENPSVMVKAKQDEEDELGNFLLLNLEDPSEDVSSLPYSERLFDQLFEDKIEVAVFKGGETSYKLYPDALIFDIGQDVEQGIETPDTLYRRLVSSKDKDNLKSGANKEPYDFDFFPLGWLSEHQLRVLPLRGKSKTKFTKTQTQRQMRYVVALNVSSTPWSVWLIYLYNRFVEQRRRFLDEDDDGIEWKEEASKITSLYHTLSKGDKTFDSSPVFLDYSFDLGQICSDVQDWDPIKGLDIEKVKSELEQKHFVKTRPLSLVPSEKEPAKTSKPKIDLGDFGLSDVEDSDAEPETSENTPTGTADKVKEFMTKAAKIVTSHEATIADAVKALSDNTAAKPVRKKLKQALVEARIAQRNLQDEFNAEFPADGTDFWPAKVKTQGN